MIIIELVTRYAAEHISNKRGIRLIVKLPGLPQAVAVRQHFAVYIVTVVVIKTGHFARQTMRDHNMVAITEISDDFIFTVTHGN